MDCGASDILAYTSKYFDYINFNELNDSWVIEVIENEFVDVEENNITINILFVHDALKTLCKLADVCQAWYEKFSDGDESVTLENTSLQENVLWTYLNGMDINVKQILGIIYLLCSKAVKPTSTLEEKELGLGSAKWYFSCLRVPGSAAYSVYHPNLYSLCIDCFYIPPESKDAWNEYESLLPLFVEALDVLVPLLSEFHFDRDSGTIEHTIKKLSELAANDVSKNELNFSTDFVNMNKKERRRRYQIAFVITSLAYQGLTSLMQTDLNGEKDYNYSIILSHLNRLLLCCKATSSPIPHKFLVIKDNAVAFICYNLNCDKDFYSRLTLSALKRLCMAVTDKTEFRSVVADSVFTILYHLNTEDIAQMIRWLLSLVDSSEIKDRVVSLEILNLLLTNFKQINCDGLSEDLEIYLTPLPLVYAVLTRCDDTSPAVRTKALGVLSQSMEHVLKFIMEMRDKTDFPEETFEDVPEKEYTSNGYHRVFWYELKSFRERLNEIASILVRRIEDNNVTARRAALQALEKLITFDLTYLNVENIKLFLNAAMDSNVVVRKQMIQSLTAVLGNYYDKSAVQVYWIKCIFPLVNDPETGVQVKALAVLEEQFLQNIFSNDHTERDRAFSLLNHLSNGQLLSYKRYLQKAFNSWKSENKLRYQVVGQLEKHFGKNNDKCIWFYLSIFAAYSKLPSKICSYLEDTKKYENIENFPDFMDLILKVLGYALNSLPEKKLKDIGDIFKKNLLQFVIPVELISITIEVLHKIEKHLENQEEFSEFSSEITALSVDCLSQFVFERHLKNTPSEELIAKHLCVVKEFCQISASYISEEVILILKTFISSNINGFSPVPRRITPILRAHAFATLGKILLQEEKLAKEILPIIAKELTTSEEGMIRNNIVMILIEMCKRYTCYADRYIQLLSLCFKDKLYLVRYQTITLLISLFQEDYIKFKGPLFFCILSTIIDKYESIQELGRYCLCQLLYSKRKTIFSEYFVDSIFVLNNYAPPDNEPLARTVTNLKQFALKGDKNRETRLLLYKFMLDNMCVTGRALLVNQLCQEILSSVAEAVFPLNEATESMVKDCFMILNSKEIRFDENTIEELKAVTEDADEPADEEGAAKTELQTRRVIIIDPIIPVIISLKNCLMHAKSELISDLILFLRDLLQDYKTEISSILAADKMLERQVQIELKNQIMHMEKQSKDTNKDVEKDMDQIPGPPRADQFSKMVKERTSCIMNSVLEDSRPEVNGEQLNGSVRLIPRTHARKSSSRHSDTNKANVQTSIASCSSQCEIPEMSDNKIQEIMMSSTPRVVLTALKIPKDVDLNNISLIDAVGKEAMDVDNDSSD